LVGIPGYFHTGDIPCANLGLDRVTNDKVVVLMICDWCERDHTGFVATTMEEFIKALLDLAAKDGYSHVYIGKQQICKCGQPCETKVVDIPGPAHPAVPITFHSKPGCPGAWVHNKEFMQEYGLVPVPLPCSDPMCNIVWDNRYKSIYQRP
jgi:hypothetical protein